MSDESVNEMRKEITRLTGRTCESHKPKYLKERLADLRARETERKAAGLPFTPPKIPTGGRGKSMTIYVPPGWDMALPTAAEKAKLRSVSELIREAVLEYADRHKLGANLADLAGNALPRLQGADDAR